MRAGALRQVISIQSKTLTQDSYGGSTEAWSDFAANLRAKAIPLSGRELVAAQAAQNATAMKFETRFVPGITQAMRVVYGGRYYNITAVLNIDELSREMHILTETGLTNG